MTDTCDICVEKYNLSTRKLVSCPYCQFDACKTCCETYVLGETSPKCMNTTCNREWQRQFITSSFPNTFINGKLKKHREQVLFDQERALLPSTQPVVEREIKIESEEKKLRDNQKLIRELKNQQYELQMEIWRLRDRNAPVERAEFIRACPDNGCRGFLSTQWKCGICEKWACPDCHEVKGLTRDVEHVCNPDTLATARLLSIDTKPCPSCRMGIFKIEGCPQMFCTSCNTGFNWITGRIETNIHNPHYFEWLRRNNGGNVPRTPGDVPCRNDINHQNYITVRGLLTNVGNSKNQFSKACDDFLAKVVRNTIHLRYVIMGTYNVGYRVRRNEILRIAYMRNKITEQNFKITLQRNQKKIEKHTEIHNILEILLTTITEIVYRFIDNLRNTVEGNWNMAILEEIDPIVDYTNECLREISITYGSKLIRFSNEIHCF